MRVARYESEAGVPLPVDVPEGKKAPATVLERGVRYRLVHEGVDFAAIRAEIGGFTTAAARPKLRDRHFESVQACRWDPDAPAHNPKTGAARFDSQREVDEYVAKKNHQQDVETRYGELD